MANEFTTTNPDNRRLTNFPYGVTSRGLSVSTAIDIGDFGYESNSTAAQTTAAINAAIAFAYANGYGVVLLPPRRLPVEDGIVLYSNVVLRGYGVGITVLVAQSSLSGTDNLITNVTDTIADLTTRTDKNFGIEHLTIDASAATYVSYPTAGYTSAGSLFRFRRAINCFVRHCEFLDFRQGYAIRELGCLNADFSSNKFERCGKGDFSSGGISSTPYGSNRIIRSISKANPCVITFFEAHAFDIGNVYISDVRGMTELTDGTYAVTATTTLTITIGAVNSTAYTTYILDPNSRVSTTSTIESEATTIRGNTFKDVYRLAAQIAGIRGVIEGNTVSGAGEAGFFSQSGRYPVISNNRISGVTVTDIVGSGIELDYVLDPIVNNNIISRCEGNGIRIGGVIGGEVSGNQITEMGVTAGLLYPAGPQAVAAGIDGDAFPDEKRAGITFINQDEFPCRGFYSAGNTFREMRDGAAALMAYGYYIGKSGSNSMNGPFTIHRPDFTYYNKASTFYIASAATSINIGAHYEYVDPTLGMVISGDVGTGAVSSTPMQYNQSTAAQGPAFSATTYVTGSSIAVPSGSLKIGSRYRCLIDLSKTAVGTAAIVITVRYGTAATTGGSTAIATLTFPAQTAAADDGTLIIDVTFRAVGASAVIQAKGTLTHDLAATGLSVSNAPTKRATSGAFDSAVASSIIGIAMNAGASANVTVDLVQAILENLV
jgi:parallel beta-helix repeat protein